MYVFCSDRLVSNLLITPLVPPPTPPLTPPHTPPHPPPHPSRAVEKKAAIVFVPSRKQSQLTAIDMVTYAAADGQPDRFLNATEEEMRPVLETVRDAALQQTLGHGVGFIHQGMMEDDRKRVEGLYKDGIIKVTTRAYRCLMNGSTIGILPFRFVVVEAMEV